MTDEKLSELIGGLELAIQTAPNVPEANLSNGCIKMVLDALIKLQGEAT